MAEDIEKQRNRLFDSITSRLYEVCILRNIPNCHQSIRPIQETAKNFLDNLTLEQFHYIRTIWLRGERLDRSLFEWRQQNDIDLIEENMYEDENFPTSKSSRVHRKKNRSKKKRSKKRKILKEKK